MSGTSAELSLRDTLLNAKGYGSVQCDGVMVSGNLEKMKEALLQGDGTVSADHPDSKFQKELEQLINKYSKENGSNTPDFVLAEYLAGCLKNFDYAVRYRDSTKTS